MRVIAVANHKGGVGKTTVAVNLAAGLAKAGRRTLLVDADAQSHATTWLSEVDEVEHDLRDVIVSGIPVEKIISPTRIEGLDLLPATLGLAMLEVEMVGMTKREDRIARALRPIADRYEIAVADLPPSLSLTVIASLTAADHIIAPVSAANLSLGGLVTFLDWTDRLRAEEVVRANLLGVLVTMADSRTKIAREVVDAVRGSGLPMFDTVIPRRAIAEDQVRHRMVFTDRDASIHLAVAYGDLTAEVLSRLEAARG